MYLRIILLTFFFTFLLFLASHKSISACPETKMLNTSKEPWVEYDYKMLEYAKKRCTQIWQDTPCVKLFKKYDKKQYSVICGFEE